MKYFTADELRQSRRAEARAVLARKEFAGKTVRDRLAIGVFNTYHDRIFPERARTRILDVGAASGLFAAELAEAGYRLISGADLDDYVEAGRRSLFRELVTCDLSTERLPWPDKSFDAVTAWCVLPHLENPFHAVREIHRVLAPGGLFIFTAPHLSSKPSRDYFLRHGDFRSYRPTNNHIILFTRGVIEKTILQYFELMDTEYPVRPKIFRSPIGKIRELVHRLTALNPKLKKALESRWAYDAAYILRKRS